MKGKKTGGRKAGTPNKTTEELRNMVQAFLEEQWETIHKDFELLKPEQRVGFIIKLLDNVLAKPITSLEQLTESQLDELLKRLTNETKGNKNRDIEPAA